MQLLCNLGPFGKQSVEVKKSDPLSIFLDLLSKKDKNLKFIFNGQTYSVNTNTTFEEIGLNYDTNLFFICQAISA
jgi:hypothetical protein